jgi:hypothetical protein
MWSCTSRTSAIMVRRFVSLLADVDIAYWDER